MPRTGGPAPRCRRSRSICSENRRIAARCLRLAHRGLSLRGPLPQSARLEGLPGCRPPGATESLPPARRTPSSERLGKLSAPSLEAPLTPAPGPAPHTPRHARGTLGAEPRVRSPSKARRSAPARGGPGPRLPEPPPPSGPAGGRGNGGPLEPRHTATTRRNPESLTILTRQLEPRLPEVYPQGTRQTGSCAGALRGPAGTKPRAAGSEGWEHNF